MCAQQRDAIIYDFTDVYVLSSSDRLLRRNFVFCLFLTFYIPKWKPFFFFVIE